MPKKEILLGTTFGDLVYIGEAGSMVLPSGQSPRLISCKCSACGRVKIVLFLHFIRGRIKTCGCRVDKEGRKDNRTRLHNVWKAINYRVKPYAHPKAKRVYFDKGIDICPEWAVYSVFKKWALENGFEPHLQIDRRDNSKGYHPENCRWVTVQVNMSNRSVTKFVEYKGRVLPFMDLVREFNFDHKRMNTVYNRIMKGWSVERAFDEPIRTGRYKTNKE